MNQYWPQVITDVWRKLKVDAKQLETLFPKRYRKNDVTCPITGLPTRNQSGINERAWDLVLKGLRWEEEDAARKAGKIWVAYRYEDVPHWNSLATNYRDSLRILEEGSWGSGLSDRFQHRVPGVFEMIGVQHNDKSSRIFETWAGDSMSSLSKQENWWLTREWLIEPPKTRPSWDGLDLILVNAEQREWLKILWYLVQKEFNRCAVANSKDGMGFLKQMASGEASIDDFNKVTARLDSLKE